MPMPALTMCSASRRISCAFAGATAHKLIHAVAKRTRAVTLKCNLGNCLVAMFIPAKFERTSPEHARFQPTPDDRQ